MTRNIERDRENSRRWYRNNREKAQKSNLQWRKENPERRKETTRKWKLENAERVRLKAIEWHKNNPGKHSEYGKRRRKNPKNKLNLNISVAICNSLKDSKNGWHWEELVGYTLQDLREHLEKQFTEGMSWENYGLKGWTIDHRIPIKAFNFETANDLDFKECWKLRNLRPLWHVANISKKDRLTRPHQPSLLLQEVA